MKLPDWAARMARAFAEEFRASVTLVARAAIMLMVGGAILALASQGSLYSPTTGTVSGLNLTNNYNGAIDAVNTCNSGSSSPNNQLSGAPSLGNCWLDTSVSPNRVRLYDGSSTWVIVGYIDPANHVYIPVTGGGTSNLASASTADLCSANSQTFLTITGTTGISSFGSSCMVGQLKVLYFAGALTLTNSASLVLPTGANIGTAAGDVAAFAYEGAGIWQTVWYQRANGQALALQAGLIVPWSITGGLPSSIAGTNTTATLSISAVTAADATATTYIGWVGSKSWAVSNGNAINGYAGGTTLPNSSTIHMYDCHGASGDGSYASTTAPGSFNASSCPSGYNTYARRLFSFLTNSSGAPLAIIADEVDGGAIQAYPAGLTTDINSATLPTGSRTLYLMSVPSGIKVQWQGNVSSPTAGYIWVSSPDEPDISPGTGGAAGAFFDQSNQSTYVLTPAERRAVVTNTSGQIGVRSSTSSIGYGVTTGWVDFRRS